MCGSYFMQALFINQRQDSRNTGAEEGTGNWPIEHHALASRLHALSCMLPATSPLSGRFR
jgi:hypothetical protein